MNDSNEKWQTYHTFETGMMKLITHRDGLSSLLPSVSSWAARWVGCAVWLVFRKVDKKAMIRNDTTEFHILTCPKHPTGKGTALYQHKVILNKMKITWISQRQTENSWTLTIRINHNRITTLGWSVINYWGWGLKPVLRTRPHTGFFCGSNMYKLFGLHEGLPTHCQWKINNKHNIYYKSRLITDMKQDEYSTAKPRLKRWSKRNTTVEPPWARPKTDHQAPVNFIESLGDLRFNPWVWPHVFCKDLVMK